MYDKITRIDLLENLRETAYKAASALSLTDDPTEPRPGYEKQWRKYAEISHMLDTMLFEYPAMCVFIPEKQATVPAKLFCGVLRNLYESVYSRSTLDLEIPNVTRDADLALHTFYIDDQIHIAKARQFIANADSPLVSVTVGTDNVVLALNRKSRYD